MARMKKDPARKLIEQLLRSHHRELLRKQEGQLAKKSRNVMKRDMKFLNEWFFGNRPMFNGKPAIDSDTVQHVNCKPADAEETAEPDTGTKFKLTNGARFKKK